MFYSVAKLLSWHIRWTPWNRAVAVWPIVGFAGLVFAALHGVAIALAWIGIPQWDSNWSRDHAIEVLKHDYGMSSRPAIVGRFISWADIRLDGVGATVAPAATLAN